MVSAKYFFNFFFELLRHMSHGSPEVGEIFWAFAVAEVLNGDAPKFIRKVQV